MRIGTTSRMFIQLSCFLCSDGRADDTPSKWDWPTIKAAKPDEMSSNPVSGSSVAITTTAPQKQTPWGNVGQNHLPPRGDISDLVNKTGVKTTGEIGPPGGKAVVGKSQESRLSNGFSSHNKAELSKEEAMEVEPASSKQGGTDDRGVEVEAGSRHSQGSSDDELRQSVGSITSNEFNPNVFGAVRDGEDAGQGPEAWLTGGGGDSSGGPATTDPSPHQVRVIMSQYLTAVGSKLTYFEFN